MGVFPRGLLFSRHKKKFGSSFVLLVLKKMPFLGGHLNTLRKYICSLISESDSAISDADYKFFSTCIKKVGTE